jgi:hypothetical protein
VSATTQTVSLEPGRGARYRLHWMTLSRDTRPRLLLVDPHDSDQLINLSFIVFVTLIVSLQRAWSLLKGKHLASARGTAVTRDHDPPP